MYSSTVEQTKAKVVRQSVGRDILGVSVSRNSLFWGLGSTLCQHQSTIVDSAQPQTLTLALTLKKTQTGTETGLERDCASFAPSDEFPSATILSNCEPRLANQYDKIPLKIIIIRL